MSSEALRTVFAEFGFKIDDKGLDALLKKTEEGIKLQEQLSTVEKKALAEVKKKQAEEKKAAADAEKAAEKEAAANGTLADSLGNVHPALGKLAELAGVGGVQLTGLMVRSAGLAAGIAALVVGLHRFATGFAADVAQLREAADAARVTEHEFQALSHAGNAAGVSASAMASGLNTLGQGLRAIETRSGGPTGALWRLGVRARNANGTMRETNDVLYDLADRFERVQHPVRRARLAQELFGANWRQMLRTMDGGSAALRRQHADFERLGGGVLPEAVAAGRGFTVAQGRMKVAMDSLRSVLATSLLPAMTRTTNAVANITGWFSRMMRGTHLVEGGLTALRVAGVAVGARLLVAFAPILLPMAKMALVVGLLAFAFDEIKTTLEGGDSLLSRFIDSTYGAGTAARTVQTLRDAWKGVTQALSEAGQGLRAMRADWQEATASARSALRSVEEASRSAARSIYEANTAGFRAAWAELEPIARPAIDRIAELGRGVWDTLSTAVSAFFQGIGDRIARLARATGLTALAERVQRAAAPHVQDAQRAVTRGVTRVNDARAGIDNWSRASAVGRLGSFANDITSPMAMMSEWSGILRPGGAPTTATVSPAVAAAVASRGGSTSSSSTTNQFHITGVTDPNAVAQRVSSILEEQQRQRRDQNASGGRED